MITKKKQKVELSLEEVPRFFQVSMEEFQKKARELKIPMLKSGKFSEDVLEKYFQRSDTISSHLSKIIAVSNQKGGEGKTTISLFLSEALSFESRVLLVDWDPQANATRLFVNDPERTVRKAVPGRDGGGRAGGDVAQGTGLWPAA